MNNNNAMPENLSESAQQAYHTIMSLLTTEDATDTGGCKTFYSPSEWAARGEEYGKDALLIVVYDGGAVRPYFSLDADYPWYGRHTKMSEAIAAAGFYVEECTCWYAAVYPK